MEKLPQTTFDRLPKSAQQYIKDLELRLKAANQKISSMMDIDTISNFYSNDYVCSDQPPRLVKKYYQTHQMSFDNGKIEACFYEHENGDLKISFNGNWGYETYIKPDASNCITIVPVRRQ